MEDSDYFSSENAEYVEQVENRFHYHMSALLWDAQFGSDPPHDKWEFLGQLVKRLELLHKEVNSLVGTEAASAILKKDRENLIQ